MPNSFGFDSLPDAAKSGGTAASDDFGFGGLPGKASFKGVQSGTDGAANKREDFSDTHSGVGTTSSLPEQPGIIESNKLALEKAGRGILQYGFDKVGEYFGGMVQDGSPNAPMLANIPTQNLTQIQNIGEQQQQNQATLESNYQANYEQQNMLGKAGRAAEYYGREAANNAAPVAIGVGTGVFAPEAAPVVLPTLFGGMAAGDTYAESRAAGNTPEIAEQRAAASGAINASLALLPAEAIASKIVSPYLKSAMVVGTNEVAGTLAAPISMAADDAITGKTRSADEYLAAASAAAKSNILPSVAFGLGPIARESFGLAHSRAKDAGASDSEATKAGLDAIQNATRASNAAAEVILSTRQSAPRSSSEALRGEGEVPPMEGSGPPAETAPRAPESVPEASQRPMEDSTQPQELSEADLSPAELAAFQRQTEPTELSANDLSPEERLSFGFEDLIENNASGESATSLEAQNRFRDEQDAGQHRMILNRDGSVTPIVTSDGVDYAAKDGQIIVQSNVWGKDWGIIDQGGVPDAIAEGRINAAKDNLNRAAIERMKPDEEITLSSENTPSIEEPKTTSTKNAVVEAERAAEGRDPIIKEVSKSHQKVVEEAQAEIAKNPAVADGIVAKLTNDGPNSISTKEEAILLLEKTRLQNAREDAANRASDPKATEEQKAQAKAEWNSLEARLNEMDHATDASGSEWGSFGAFRQRQMRRDFSLAAMESRERVARGRPLNEAEAAQLKAHADKIAQLQDALDKGSSARTIDSKEAFTQLAKDLSAQLRAPSKRPWLETMKTNADDSRKALESMFKRASAGVDPMAFYHLSRIGAYHIANGAVKFSDFVGRMKNELGDKFEDFNGSMKDVYNAAKLQRDALRAAKRPQMTEEGYQQRAEKSLQKRIEVIQDKIARGDYKKTARTERELNKSNLELSYQLSKLKQQYGERQFQIEQEKRPTIKKIFGNAREGINLARAIQTSVDLSAVLRQGGFVTLGRPLLAAKSVVPMLKAFANEKNAFKVQEEIAHRPNARLYEKSGLELTKANDHHLTKLEEQYMSRWIGKLPTVLGGGLIRGSERAFKTFLNKLRADTFDAMVGSLSKSGTPTPEEAKAIANYINVATGRGHIGVKGSGAVGLNTLFFAPRLVASRFNLLAGQPLYGGSARTRKMVAKEYARFAAGLGVVYTLGAMAHAGSGDKDKFVETDPRSSNFGKMKFGNTYIDPLAGLGQIATVIAREATGETKTQKGAILPLRKDNKLLNAFREKPDNSAPGFGKPTAADVALNFARTKLAPVPGAVLNVLSGKNVIGQPTSIGKEAKQLITPLSFQNVEGVLKENGIVGGSAITVLEMLGTGVQYRDPNQKWK